MSVLLTALQARSAIREITSLACAPFGWVPMKPRSCSTSTVLRMRSQSCRSIASRFGGGTTGVTSFVNSIFAGSGTRLKLTVPRLVLSKCEMFDKFLLDFTRFVLDYSKLWEFAG